MPVPLPITVLLMNRVLVTLVGVVAPAAPTCQRTADVDVGDRGVGVLLPLKVVPVMVRLSGRAYPLAL